MDSRFGCWHALPGGNVRGFRQAAFPHVPLLIAIPSPSSATLTLR